MQLELSLVLKQWKEVISRSAVGLLTAQVAREAYFNGQSYLDLKLDNLPGITDNFYAGVGFRTEKSNALLLYHQAEVLILTDQLAKPSVMILLKRYVSKVYAVCVLCVFSPQSGVCQVQLKEGYVVVTAGKNEVRTQKTYNDENSHYVAFYSNMNGYSNKQHTACSHPHTNFTAWICV